MKKNVLYSIILWILMPCLIDLQAAESLRFTHIGLDEGLSQSTIFHITQDEKGNMWFATHNGLNKYNGYEFTIYQHDDRNPHSIANDIIRTCYKDNQGNIWAGTAQGLSFYDVDKDCFENFILPTEKACDIKSIADFDNDRLLVHVNKRLMLFDRKERQFTQDSLPEELARISPTTINRQGDNLFIGSKNGLFIYSTIQKRMKTLNISVLNNKNILAILSQSADRLWIGTEGDGLFLINPQTQQFTHYKHTDGKDGNISSDYIRSLALDPQGQLWIGTINGLNIYNPVNDSFQVCDDENGTTPYVSVRSIFKDAQEGMWIGTYFEGINYYHPLKRRFQHLQLANRSSIRNHNVTGCIREDADGNLWIGTSGNGLYCYNPHSQKTTSYTLQNGLKSNDIKTIYIDYKNKLTYVGTHIGGMYIIHQQSGKVEPLDFAGNKNIYAIEPDQQGNLWLSGLSQILYYRPTDRKAEKVKIDRPALMSGITFIFRDRKDRLWIGGKNGIDTFNDHDGTLTHLQLFPTNTPFKEKYVNCIHETSNGLFWIATRNGLYRFDEKTHETKHYTTSQGLPSNVIHGILEDDYGKLWLSTDNGMSYLQPQTDTFRNYTVIDGLPSNQFTDNAFCRTSDGKMFFGSINGITYFHPAQLVDNPYTPPVIITQLHLFNKPVRPGDDTGILEKDISNTQRITLTAKQKMFSLQFVTPNYIAGKHNTFAYTLQGYDQEWYYTNSLHTVSYSNLPHGTYCFLVKAANNDGKWNEIPTRLEIVILPVWYKTWWAFLLFTLISIAIAVAIFRFFWIRNMMATQIEFERKDKERQKEVNEMKLRFFINIAHELRTPLTLILAPILEMKSRLSDRWMQQQLEYVWQNTNRLLRLVNQLMDYRQAELGVFALKAYPNPIHQLVEKIFHIYRQPAQRKNIQYTFLSEIKGKNVLCDPNYIELIINNLLSNAFKHTPKGQNITVSLKEEKQHLLLQVQDTGSGIPKDKQKKIFERFYQVEHTQFSNGIGLSLVQKLVELHHGHIELDSKEGEGSTFSVYLPTISTAYQPHELGSLDYTQSPKPHDIKEDMTYFPYIDELLSSTGPENDPENTDANGNNSIRRKQHILIAEDNQEIRQYLSKELGIMYNIWEAHDGMEALHILQNQEIDLVLTDVMMPIMDGLQLCKQIKQNVQTSHIPVIILSAKAELNEQLDGLQIGADDYIPKPFALPVIKMKIRNLFRTRYRTILHYSQSLEIEPEKMSLNPVDEDFLRKAKETVERHLDDQNFSTEIFAQEMCMSRSGLHLKMKALTGESTYDFIRKIRFHKASQLLREGGYTIAEISNMTGFNTPSYFSTSFKKYFGCLPTEYAYSKKDKQN
ncbi:hybrid sensor histidine kinase/response regulator transcription factor [Phocaeicola plebeius]|uniref:hybrid sensor histidine kinase/response regulator transcription factor n=1 Tax=Phocaeicola plebeius TaxID=310297 RepID=UPI0026F2ED12|nr:hybrid sensor histidine kinase/response regulator transcription factor [Phocaeicola plebeius]